MKWEPLRRIFSKSRAEMIRKVYEVDSLVCSKCQGHMRIIAFLKGYEAVDQIIDQPWG